MKRRAHPETALHLACAQYLRVALRPPTLWFAIDHGAGRMTPSAAGLLKARGGVRGLPDLMILHPIRDGTQLLGLELKAGMGRPSQTQEEMAVQFRAVGGGYEFCRSLNEVQHALLTSGIPLHATVAGNGSLWPRKAA